MEQILYLDLEFAHILDQINNLYGDEFIYFLKSLGIYIAKEIFLFIDEVHYLENPLEVKYQSYKKPKIPSGVKSFIHEYKPDKAIIITRDYFDKFTLEKTTIVFLPAWAA